MMKPIKEIAQEMRQRYEEREANSKTQENTNLEKEDNWEFWATVADYLVDSLKLDNKREVTNFPKVQVMVGNVKEENSKSILSFLSLIYSWLKAFKFPAIQKVEGEVTVKNQVIIPEVKFPEYPKQIKSDITSLPKYVQDELMALRKQVQSLSKAIDGIELKPNIQVASPEVKIDLASLQSQIKALQDTIREIEVSPVVNIDTDELNASMGAVKSSIESIKFPIPNFQSSWQHSLEMQSKDRPKKFIYTTVGGSKVISYIEMVGNDGNTYRKTYSYTSNDPENPDADSGWVQQ